MLHALLHRKLDPLRPEAHRLEDALTSSVFTTLLHAGAGRELSEWFSRSETVHGQSAAVDSSIDGAWFWPRLAHAEPDIVLKLGSTLVVIEAKLRSDRHDRALDDQVEAAPLEADQVRRQWKSLGDPHATSDPALRRALAECRPVLIYLVNGARIGRARREVLESATALPADAEVRLLTWQSLYGLLARGSDRATESWKKDLLGALDLFGVGGFAGFGVLDLFPDELECVRQMSLAEPGHVEWSTATIDDVAMIAVARWSWKRPAQQAWNWDVPALEQARASLTVLAPFLLKWTMDGKKAGEFPS